MAGFACESGLMGRIITARVFVASVAGALCLAMPAGALASAPPARRDVTTGVTWRHAKKVPGTAALNAGGFAEVTALSCASAGNCAAGGYYHDGSGLTQSFVVSERNGSWAKAREIRRLVAMNIGGRAEVTAMSCPSAGNCAAGGTYIDGAGSQQVFTVSEKDGAWGKAIKIPGSGRLNTGGFADLNSMSCPSPGNCAVGGDYADASGFEQAFVAAERDGTWGKAITVPGVLALNLFGQASVSSVSCPAAGDCAAGGSYSDSNGDLQAFVVSERNGTWGKAFPLPGARKLNAGVRAEVNSVSCASAGNCAVAGDYTDGAGNLQALVASERNGTWGKAIRAPGSAVLNKGFALLMSVSCGAAGDCSAGGDYTDGAGHVQALVVSERNGAWGKAIGVPGLGPLNAGGTALVLSVSCGAAGNCAAGGAYTDAAGHLQAFVASQQDGHWRTAQEVPGSAALNASGLAAVLAVSCAAASRCGAGGFYLDAAGHRQAFITEER